MEYSIAVVDDDDDVRRMIVELLKQEAFEVSDFSKPTDFLEATRNGANFDCVLLDERMDEMSGLETFRRFKNPRGSCPAIMVTGHATTKLTLEAIDAGFVYLFEKPIEKERLVQKTRRYCEEYRNSRNDIIRQENEFALLASLSTRERQVLQLLAGGSLNKQIASELEVGLRTVETYRQRVMTKIGANSFADAVAFAISVKLREPGVRHRAG